MTAESNETKRSQSTQQDALAEQMINPMQQISFSWRSFRMGAVRVTIAQPRKKKETRNKNRKKGHRNIHQIRPPGCVVVFFFSTAKIEERKRNWKLRYRWLSPQRPVNRRLINRLAEKNRPRVIGTRNSGQTEVTTHRLTIGSSRLWFVIPIDRDIFTFYRRAQFRHWISLNCRAVRRFSY